MREIQQTARLLCKLVTRPRCNKTWEAQPSGPGPGPWVSFLSWIFTPKFRDAPSAASRMVSWSPSSIGLLSGTMEDKKRRVEKWVLPRDTPVARVYIHTYAVQRNGAMPASATYTHFIIAATCEPSVQCSKADSSPGYTHVNYCLSTCTPLKAWYNVVSWSYLFFVVCVVFCLPW